MPESLRTFLVESFEIVRKEHPRAHARMCEALVGRRVLVESEGDRFTCVFSAHEVRVAAPAEGADVQAHLDRHGVLELLDGERSLREALLDGRLALRGNVRELVAFQDGLRHYLDAAVRAPGLGALLERFRNGSRGGAAHPSMRTSGEAVGRVEPSRRRAR